MYISLSLYTGGVENHSAKAVSKGSKQRLLNKFVVNLGC